MYLNIFTSQTKLLEQVQSHFLERFEFRKQVERQGVIIIKLPLNSKSPCTKNNFKILNQFGKFSVL